MKKFNSPDTAKKRSILKKDTLYKEETEKLISDSYQKNVSESSETGSAFIPVTTSSIHAPLTISGTSFVPTAKPLKAAIGPKSGSKSHAQPIKFVGLDDDTESVASGRGSPSLSISHAPDTSFLSGGTQRHPPLSPSLSKTLQFPDTPPLPDGALDRRHTFQESDLFGQQDVAPVDSSTVSGSPAHGGHRIHRVPSYCANTSTYGPSRSSTPTTTVAASTVTTTAPPSKSELANSVVGLPLLLATVPIVSPISSTPSNPSSAVQTCTDDKTALQPDAVVESHHPPLLAQPSQQSTTDEDSVFGHEPELSMMSRQSSKESATIS
ncbi:hypothetical protein X975_01504, partial [Stegodyphus mimosarum]